MPGRTIQFKPKKHDIYNKKKKKQDYPPTMKDCNYHFKWETIEVQLQKGIFATMIPKLHEMVTCSEISK